MGCGNGKGCDVFATQPAMPQAPYKWLQEVLPMLCIWDYINEVQYKSIITTKMEAGILLVPSTTSGGSVVEFINLFCLCGRLLSIIGWIQF